MGVCVRFVDTNPYEWSRSRNRIWNGFAVVSLRRFIYSRPEEIEAIVVSREAQQICQARSGRSVSRGVLVKEFSKVFECND